MATPRRCTPGGGEAWHSVLRLPWLWRDLCGDFGALTSTTSVGPEQIKAVKRSHTKSVPNDENLASIKSLVITNLTMVYTQSLPDIYIYMSFLDTRQSSSLFHLQSLALPGFLDTCTWHGDLQVDNVGVRLDVVNESIESEEFWAKLHTLEKLFSTIRALMIWVEQCPCHQHRTATTPSIRKRWEACPLRARRLPELVNGALFEVLHKISCVSVSELFLELDSVSKDVRCKCIQVRGFVGFVFA